MLPKAVHNQSLCTLIQHRSTAELASLVLDHVSAQKQRSHQRRPFSSQHPLHSQPYRLSDSLSPRQGNRDGSHPSSSRNYAQAETEHGRDDSDMGTQNTYPAFHPGPKFSPLYSNHNQRPNAVPHPRSLRPLLFAPSFPSSLIGESVEPLVDRLQGEGNPAALYVQNLPTTARRSQLLGVFQEFGVVDYIYVTSEDSAYIHYVSRASATKALQEYARHPLFVNGQEVIVYRALGPPPETKTDKEEVDNNIVFGAPKTWEEEKVSWGHPPVEEPATWKQPKEKIVEEPKTVYIPNFMTDFPPSSDVFVGNLPFAVSKKSLQHFWSKFGTLLDVYIGKYPVLVPAWLDNNGDCLGYAHLAFASLEDARAVLARGAGQGFMYGERMIRVGYGDGGANPWKLKSKTLYIHKWFGPERALREAFSPCRGFMNLIIEPPIVGKPWRAAFVQFEDVIDASDALITLNGKEILPKHPALDVRLSRTPMPLKVELYRLTDPNAFCFGDWKGTKLKSEDMWGNLVLEPDKEWEEVETERTLGRKRHAGNNAGPRRVFEAGEGWGRRRYGDEDAQFGVRRDLSEGYEKWKESYLERMAERVKAMEEEAAAAEDEQFIQGQGQRGDAKTEDEEAREVEEALSTPWEMDHEFEETLRIREAVKVVEAEEKRSWSAAVGDRRVISDVEKTKLFDYEQKRRREREQDQHRMSELKMRSSTGEYEDIHRASSFGLRSDGSRRVLRQFRVENEDNKDEEEGEDKARPYTGTREDYNRAGLFGLRSDGSPREPRQFRVENEDPKDEDEDEGRGEDKAGWYSWTQASDRAGSSRLRSDRSRRELRQFRVENEDSKDEDEDKARDYTGAHEDIDRASSFGLRRNGSRREPRQFGVENEDAEDEDKDKDTKGYQYRRTHSEPKSARAFGLKTF
ncbi:hypothetical protein EW146_g10016 [Bondarzewia mesenterica]|uniref:RRM domain-containing protein n=1 Tax=Bondarzewia mesenterica TaxID=1095465 RepID=A0A4S4L1P7_9AGAM|nr:hypothetical protein EW146_g10016 [Bondarzewia mesenterica]